MAIYEMLTDIKKSPAISTLLLHALTFLPALAEDIKKDPKAVVEKFERLRQALVKPEVMRLSVAGDILSMKNPRSTWEKNFIQVEVSRVIMSPYHPGLLTLRQSVKENAAETVDRS